MLEQCERGTEHIGLRQAGKSSTGSKESDPFRASGACK